MKKRLELVFGAALCCFLWGTAIPVLKTLYKELEIDAGDMYTKLVLAGIRFLIASLLIGIYVLFRDKKITKPKIEYLKIIVIFGLLNTTLQYLFFYVGVGNTGAIKGVLIDTIKPLLVVVMAHLYLNDDKLSKPKLIGIGLGMIGIVIANIDRLSSEGIELSISFYGEGFLLISSVVYAMAVVYGKRAMKVISSTMLNMYQMFIGSIILLVWGLIGTGGFYLSFTSFSAVLLLYSSFLSAVAFVLWYRLIDIYSASKVTVFFFLVPVFGSMISSIVFPEETLSIFVIVSLIIMSISIYLVNRMSLREE